MSTLDYASEKMLKNYIWGDKMNEEEASVKYWNAVYKLREVIEGGQRGSIDEILEELEDDLGE